MKPILYLDGTVNFDNNGIGVLVDRISGEVSNELNGKDEYVFTYPVSGAFYSEIKLRSIIKTKADDKRGLQLYRVYDISKPFNGIVTVSCEHISYDLTGIIVSRCTAANAPAALQALSTNSSTTNQFTFWTNKTTVANFALTEPTSVRRCLGGMQGSILDVYGGEYEFDNYTVRLYTSLGTDNGVTVKYGKNLIDLTQEENCASVYTGVYPYWLSPEGQYFELPEKIVNASGTFGFTRVLAVNFSQKFEEKPTATQLRNAANTYITSNKIGVPKVSMSLSYAQVEKALGLEATAIYERINIGDTVHVYFEKLGIETSARVVATRYNDELERYNSIQIGGVRANISDTMSAQAEELRDLPNSPALQQAAARASARITGNMGGYVVMHSSTGALEPDEILVMNAATIADATKVWRWNLGGLGYSSTGYSGTYGTAMTMDGEIVADFITTGTLNAALAEITNINASNITTGNISSANYAYTSGYFSTAGTRISLTSGLIRTPQFAIDSSGNAYFKGALSAATGTFAGSLSAASGTFEGTMQAGDIRSSNYAYTSGFYSDSGVRINLDTGLVRTPFLYIAGSDGYTKFAGELEAVSGTFTTLTGTTNVKLVNTTIADNAISFNNTSAGLRMDMSLDPSNDRTLFSTNHNMALAAYTGTTFYTIQMFGSDFAFVNTQTSYNMHITVPNTAEASLVPYVAGKCNIGTNTYYFDYMHANHFTTHSLRKDKSDIRDLSESDYDIDAIRPITYTLKDREGDEPQIGLIAEELEKSCYKACSHDENGELYGIDYSRLAVVAIKELQLLRKRVKDLEDKSA